MVNILLLQVLFTVVVLINIHQVVHIVMVHHQVVQQLQMDIDQLVVNVDKSNVQLTHMEQVVLVHHVQADLLVQQEANIQVIVKKQ